MDLWITITAASVRLDFDEDGPALEIVSDEGERYRINVAGNEATLRREVGKLDEWLREARHAAFPRIAEIEQHSVKARRSEIIEWDTPLLGPGALKEIWDGLESTGDARAWDFVNEVLAPNSPVRVIDAGE